MTWLTGTEHVCWNGRGQPDLDGIGAFDPAASDDTRRSLANDQVRSLSQLIEREIIPRLLVAHAQPPHARVDCDCGETVSVAEVAAFAPLALHIEADELLQHVERMVARGVSFDTLLVDLLAPAARELGALWEDDRCDFVDVTMGLWRLQEVVHELSGRAAKDLQGDGHMRRALFASLIGDTHSFGTVVIDEMFSSNGWMTDRLNEATTEDLLARVREEAFDLIGLTITCDCHIAPLPSIVRSVAGVIQKSPDLCDGRRTGVR